MASPSTKGISDVPTARAIRALNDAIVEATRLREVLEARIDELEENGGGGGITLPIEQSDVTDLVADLADKSDVGHTHPESDVTGLVADLAAKVPATRELTGTAPIRIDGGASADLSANRTISIDAFSDTVNGAVPAPNTGGLDYYLRDDGTWADPSAAIDALFGTGDDGDVVISSNTTLTRDMAYNNLTVNSGIELNTGGFRIFVKEVLTLNGKIVRNGTAGDDAPAPPSHAGGAGGAALAAGSLPGSTAGGAGDATAGIGATAGGASASRYAGLGTGAPTGAGGKCQGAAGGANSAPTAGANGGNCTELAATSGNMLYNLFQSITGRDLAGNPFTGATGGGGGKGGPGAGQGGGGGGGGGGGFIVVCVKEWSGAGTIETKGGDGGDGSPHINSMAGGGGGGGGGTVVFVGSSGAYPTCDVSGGTGGAASLGGGSVGFDGGAGHLERYRVIVAGGGSGVVADGDYGDITVSVSGGVWTIDPLAVTTGKIDDLAVTAAKVASDAVTTAKILDANVTTAKIADNNVTMAKIEDAGAAGLVGATAAGSPSYLTGTQATTLLDVATTSLKGLAPARSGVSTEYLSGTGVYSTPAGGGGGGSGLFAPTITAVPTFDNTGLGTSPSTPQWNYQPTSADAYERPNGVVVYTPSAASAAVRCATLYTVAPATPYTITALIACSHGFNTNAGVLFGFTDGTTSAAKFQAFNWKPHFTDFSVTNFPRLDGTGGATSSVRSVSYSVNPTSAPYWFRLTDDGTTVTYALSTTGDEDTWITFTSVTKSGSFLGASGFDNIAFGVFGYNGDARAQLLSWAIT